MSTNNVDLEVMRRDRLTELEDVIERHLVGFVEVGRALREIRDGKLYKETYPTFEAWAKARFDISRPRAYQLMEAVKVHENLSTVVDKLPDSERQTRPLTRLEPEDQKTVWAGALSHAGDGEVTDKHVQRAVGDLRREERQDRLVELSENSRPLDSSIGRYPIILADPPWRHDFAATESRAIENHYPTMLIEDICALPVHDVALDDCVLFLWATSPKLEESFSVINAWGFEYRTSMVWVKDRIGTGFYARQQHELILIAKRGTPPVPPPEARPSSVMHSPRGEHSKKPDKVYELIEMMYPTLPRLELFSRSPRDGWDAWGFEA